MVNISRNLVELKTIFHNKKITGSGSLRDIGGEASELIRFEMEINS